MVAAATALGSQNREHPIIKLPRKIISKPSSGVASGAEFERSRRDVKRSDVVMHGWPPLPRRALILVLPYRL
jgi:hypothetical protein